MVLDGEVNSEKHTQTNLSLKRLHTSTQWKQNPKGSERRQILTMKVSDLSGGGVQVDPECRSTVQAVKQKGIFIVQRALQKTRFKNKVEKTHRQKNTGNQKSRKKGTR